MMGGDEGRASGFKGASEIVHRRALHWSRQNSQGRLISSVGFCLDFCRCMAMRAAVVQVDCSCALIIKTHSSLSLARSAVVSQGER